MSLKNSKSSSRLHLKFMRLALELARKGLGRTSPNPAVGAVIVKNNKIIGRGYHHQTGGPHAEIFALRKAKGKTKGADLYVNLEPCAHFGRTPPCSEAIIKSGIKNVFVSMLDPNPLNNGQGIKELIKKGIKVKTGLLDDEAKKINEPFIKFISEKMPFVTLKVAQSLDGKIATFSGDSKWISGPESRNYVQELRSQVDAVMVGVNTIIKDNPRLNYRGPNLRKDKPLKVIIDPYLKVPLKAKIFSKASPAPVIIAASHKAPLKKIKILRKREVKIIKFKMKNNLISLKSLMRELAKLEITSVLLEGGGETIARALEEKIADKVLFFIAPIIIGGRQAVTSCEGLGVKAVPQAVKLEKMEVKRLGKDLLVGAYVQRHN